MTSNKSSFPSARAVVLAIAAAATLAACSAAPSGGPVPTPSPSTAGRAPGAQDIPDTTKFLTYQGTGFSIEYPEGWSQTATADGVILKNLDSSITVRIVSGALPSLDAATAESQALTGATVTKPAQAGSLPAGSAVAFSFQSLGSPDPVTGKSATLVTDRYEVAGSPAAGRYAVIDLSSPLGVDNIDAFRRIAQSFAWH